MQISLRNNNVYRLLFAGVLIVNTSLMSHPLSAQILPSNSYLRQQIDKLLRYDSPVDYQLTPGFIIGIYDGGQTTTLSYGTAGPDRKDTIGPTDVFELGSVSKVFTAVLISELDNEGFLSLEKTAAGHLTDNPLSAQLQGFTLQDLLNHATGLPKMPDGIGLTQTDPQNPYKNYTQDQFLAYLRDATIDASHIPVYSNTGYALLQLVVEAVTAMPFEQAFNRFVADRLGLDQSSTLTDTSIISPGYNLAGELATQWEFPTFAASEGMKSCARDILLLIDYLLTSDDLPLWNISPRPYNKNLAAAPGWFVIRERKAPDVYVHAGKTSGHNAYLAVVPKTDTGVIVLSNSITGTHDLGFNILRIMNRNWKRQ